MSIDDRKCALCGEYVPNRIESENVGKQRKASTFRRQTRALTAMLHQPTLRLAAGEAGVNEDTLYRWLRNDEAFKAEYLQLRQEVVRNAVFQLQKATNNAVNCLTSVMNDPEAPSSARVRAAAEVLAQSMKALEIEAMEERLSRLELLVAERVTSNGHNHRRGPNGYAY